MKKATYRISRAALQDLKSIWIYTNQKWSQAQADRYYKLIIEEIEYLSLNENAGKSMEHLKPGYKMSKVKSHLIFYRTSENKVMEIIRILHQRMNIDERLGR